MKVIKVAICTILSVVGLVCFGYALYNCILFDSLVAVTKEMAKYKVAIICKIVFSALLGQSMFTIACYIWG